MNSEELNRYQEILDKFDSLRILVLGDVMLDRYIQGKVSRISPEAPVPVVEAFQTLYAPGGAANVAMNIAHLGAKVFLLGVIGNDREGERLQGTFTDNGIDISGLVVDESRPTTTKTRIIAQNQQIVRFDHEKRDTIGPSVAWELKRHFRDAIQEVHAVVVSDYAKGVSEPGLIKELIHESCNHDRLVFVDPKGYDYDKYAGATVVAPNQHEAAQFVNQNVRDDQVLPRAAQRLLKALSCQAILITQGEEGMSLYESGDQITHIPASTRDVYDVTGAGDTVTAVFALALASGASLPVCASLANQAAGIVVGKLGASTISREELLTAFRVQTSGKA